MSDREFFEREQKAFKVLDAVEDADSVRAMVRNVLKALGYEGLYNADGECGCELGDLMPCYNTIAGMGDCKPAYHFRCYECDGSPENGGDCDQYHEDWYEIFSSDRNHCKPEYAQG